MIFIPCVPCDGTGRHAHRDPCAACGGAAVVTPPPAAGPWWPGDEPTFDDGADYVCDRERDAQIGVS